MGFSDWLAGLPSRLAPYTKTASFKLFCTVAASSLVTTLGIFSLQSLQRRVYRKALRDSIESHFPTDSARASVLGVYDDEIEDFSDAQKTKAYLAATASAASASASASGKQAAKRRKAVVDEEIINEQLARNIAFLGEEATNKVRGSFVIVVGVGGVGSAAATMLVRSGVGKIRLIDFDQVTLSSLNRHSVATLADVGTPKVLASKRHYEAIAPWVEIDDRMELFSLAEAERLLDGSPDWVIDCIDNIQTKSDLLTYCHNKGINVFSAMGAGGKCDPSRIQISDISTTFEDSLARSIRRKLRLNGITSGIPVVYSTERPTQRGKLLPLPEEEFQKGAVEELSALENFRVRILPVLGPLPCMFGQAAAAYIIAKLAGNVEMEPLAVKNRTKTYHRMFVDFGARELKISGLSRLPISEDDVGYVFEELNRGRSIVAPNFAVPSRPTLCRWRKDGGHSLDNLVVFDRDQANRHEKECLIGDKQPEEVWNEETVRLVTRRQELERQSRQYRLL